MSAARHGARRSVRGFVVGAAVVASLILVASPAMAAPGDLDPTFGSGGVVTTQFTGPSTIFGLVRQPGGKVVALGCDSDPGEPGDFALARYRTTGGLDQTFGSGGKATTPFSENYDCGRDLLRQPDGKLVAAGGANDCDDFALARYHANGTLDESFGDGGTVTTDFGGQECAHAVVLQPDGKIVAAGQSDLVGGNEDFALARYNADGTLDESFGDGGKVTTDLTGSFDDIQDIGYWDGDLIVAGSALKDGAESDFALARYEADGTLDQSFGDGGAVTTDLEGSGDRAFALVIRTNGSLVVGGTTFRPATGTDFALAGYHNDGSVDETFGQLGVVLTDFSGFGNLDGLYALKGSQGRMVAVGYAETDVAEISFAVALYNGDGSLVPGFGTGGKVITEIGAGSSTAFDVTLQGSSRLVAGGSVGEPSVFGLAGYQLS